MPAYGLHWLPTNNVYFDPPSNIVVVAEALKEFGLCCWNVENTNKKSQKK